MLLFRFNKEGESHFELFEERLVEEVSVNLVLNFLGKFCQESLVFFAVDGLITIVFPVIVKVFFVGRGEVFGKRLTLVEMSKQAQPFCQVFRFFATVCGQVL